MTVASKVAQALGRAITSEPHMGYIGIPEYEFPHGTKLHEIEYYVSKDEIGIDVLDLSYDDTEKLLQNYPQFRMNPIVAVWSSSENLGRFDSYWPESSRRLAILSPDLIKRMGLKRIPLKLDYIDVQDAIVGKYECWSAIHNRNRFGSSEREANGMRYVINRRVLCSYLDQTEQTLVLKVNIARYRPYNYSKDNDRDIWGRTLGFIFKANGELSSC